MKENVKVKPTYKTREETLKRTGIVVTIPEDWHMTDSMAAQRYGKGDVMSTNLALIQRTCLFNGEKWTMQDIEEKIGQSGRDYLQLIGEFFGGDEDEEKNG